MNNANHTPKILIIDDLFGRTHSDRRNEERANLCGQYLIEDITEDEIGKGSGQRVKHPVAQAVFHRGQTPSCSTEGDLVENDLEGTLRVVEEGWIGYRTDSTRWALIILDLCFYQGRVTAESNRRALGMPEGYEADDDPRKYFGLILLRAIHARFPDLPVIILSSKERENVSRQFSYDGALGFLPREGERSPTLLKEYIMRHGLIPDFDGEIIGNAKELLIALRTARRVASTRRNVLVRGEQGTGKELLARYINRHSQESSPFVVVNSSILTAELFGPELFGIKSGTATQVHEREGLITKADSGNLFFDEIGDMLPQVQAGILRVLEDRQVTPVGSRETKRVDARFISATNIDIEARAAKELFRQDLLERLREGGTIFLSPLRERKADIPLLIERFVRDAEREIPNALRREIVPEVFERCMDQEWTKNLRELRNCVFAAVQNNPDVEYLVPAHIHFPIEKETTIASPHSPSEQANSFSNSDKSKSIDELLDALANFRFNSAKPSDLLGKLRKIEAAYALFIARYLIAALEATSKTSESDPGGKVLIHPTVKLILGDSSVSASNAADLIKRLLKISPETIEPLLSEPKLREALETVLRLRPQRQKAKKY